MRVPWLLVLFLSFTFAAENRDGYILGLRYENGQIGKVCARLLQPEDRSSDLPKTGLKLYTEDTWPTQERHVVVASRVAFLISSTSFSEYPVPGLCILEQNGIDMNSVDIWLNGSDTPIVDVHSADFDHLRNNKYPVLVELRIDDTPVQSVFGRSLSFIVQALALISILIAGATVFLTYEKILRSLRELKAMVSRRKWITYLSLGFMCVTICSSLLLLYYFYDVAVYFVIAMFFVFGVTAVTKSLSFWILQLANWLPIRPPIHCMICGWLVKASHLVHLFVIPFSVALLSTWVVYRKDPDIGWPMQSIVGVFLISWALPSCIGSTSLKHVTILYTLLVFYDIFFVYITPLFYPSEIGVSGNVEKPGLLETVRSSARQKSIMEAVATGSAGKSGESIPVVFRLQYQSADSCFVYSSLLGFGDALIPGLLSVYLALFDAMWKTPWNRNFWASIAGYILGCFVTDVVSLVMSTGQPALLFLCPCTLGLVVLVAAIGGGRSELKKMWFGDLPEQFTGDHPFVDPGKNEGDLTAASSNAILSGDDILTVPA